MYLKDKDGSEKQMCITTYKLSNTEDKRTRLTVIFEEKKEPVEEDPF